jgi:heme/copper-type cytochrome/quinol oxidase subunit 3
MFYLRWSAEEWPAPFHFASLIMVAFLTMLGLAASVVLEMSRRAAHMEDREPAVRWIAIGIACWLTFLFLEVVEWVRLVYLLKLGPDTSFGATHLAITGAHWIAVVACVCWMTYVAADIRKHDVVAVTIYSHFLNVLWMALVVILYFTNFSLGEI